MKLVSTRRVDNGHYLTSYKVQSFKRYACSTRCVENEEKAGTLRTHKHICTYIRKYILWYRSVVLEFVLSVRSTYDIGAFLFSLPGHFCLISSYVSWWWWWYSTIAENGNGRCRCTLQCKRQQGGPSSSVSCILDDYNSERERERECTLGISFYVENFGNLITVTGVWCVRRIVLRDTLGRIRVRCLSQCHNISNDPC